MSAGVKLWNRTCFYNFGDIFDEMGETAITLLEFNRRVNRLLHDASVQRCWVVAETSDVMVRNHCYMELVQKNPDSGAPYFRGCNRTGFRQRAEGDG